MYPDYYEVITDPMDMNTIEAKIKAEKYQTESELIRDFKLMFSNCRRYNEVGSTIYEDAVTLEKVLLDRVKELGPLPDSCRYVKASSGNVSGSPRHVGYAFMHFYWEKK